MSRFLLLFLAAGFLLPSTATAQIVQIKTRNACVKVPCTGPYTCYLTGVAIDQTEDGKTLIATAGHGFDQYVLGTWVAGEKGWIPADLLAAGDPNVCDAAFILVSEKIPVYELGGNPCPGDTVDVSGFRGMEFRTFRSSVHSSTGRNIQFISRSARGETAVEGMSGGPVLSKDKSVTLQPANTIRPCTSDQA